MGVVMHSTPDLTDTWTRYQPFTLSCHCGRTGTWQRKWVCLKVGESKGKLPPRTCPGWSVQEPYRSHDWALVPANPASKAEY